MLKTPSSTLLAIMAGILMIFTASRTLDLLWSLLPQGQGILAVAALAAFDGGLVFWTLFYATGAEGTYQRTIAAAACGLDLLSIGASTIADLVQQALGGFSSFAVVVAAGAGVVVFLNVAFFFLAHLSDPVRRHQLAEQAAKDQVLEKTLEHMKRLAPEVAKAVSVPTAIAWKEALIEELSPLAIAKKERDSSVQLADPSGYKPPKSGQRRRSHGELIQLAEAMENGDYVPTSRREKKQLRDKLAARNGAY